MHYEQETCRDHEPRIPLALQSVILRGNRGLDVHAPPPDYRKSWWRLYLSNDTKNTAEKMQKEQSTAKIQSRRPKTILVKVRTQFNSIFF